MKGASSTEHAPLTYLSVFSQSICKSFYINDLCVKR